MFNLIRNEILQPPTCKDSTATTHFRVWFRRRRGDAEQREFPWQQAAAASRLRVSAHHQVPVTAERDGGSVQAAELGGFARLTDAHQLHNTNTSITGLHAG